MENEVTVTLRKQDYYGYKPLAKEGDIIRIKRYKRLRLIVTGWKQEDFCGTISTKKAYQPAPKSRLNRKSVFSKIKIKILPKSTTHKTIKTQP